MEDFDSQVYDCGALTDGEPCRERHDGGCLACNVWLRAQKATHAWMADVKQPSRSQYREDMSDAGRGGML